MLCVNSLSGCVGAIMRCTMSGQAMVGQAGKSMLASGDGNDSTDSWSHVDVDAVVLKKESLCYLGSCERQCFPC